MVERTGVSIDLEAKAILDEVAKSFAGVLVWTLGQMIRSRTIDEWKRTIHAMPSQPSPDENGDSQSEQAVAADEHCDGTGADDEPDCDPESSVPAEVSGNG